MKNYLAKLSPQKKAILGGLFALFLFQLYNYLQKWESLNIADAGAMAGGIVALVLILGPLTYVYKGGAKFKNQRPVYIEPPLWKLLPLMLLAIAASIFLFIMILAIIMLIYPPIENIFGDVENPIGSSFMVCGIILAFFAPMIIYGIVIKLRYKKIIEYGTPEWKEERKRRHNQHNL